MKAVYVVTYAPEWGTTNIEAVCKTRGDAELVIEALCAGDPDQHGGPYQRRHFDVEWHPLVSTAAGAQRDLAAALAKLRDTLRRNR